MKRRLTCHVAILAVIVAKSRVGTNTANARARVPGPEGQTSCSTATAPTTSVSATPNPVSRELSKKAYRLEGASEKRNHPWVAARSAENPLQLRKSNGLVATKTS